MLAAPTKLRPLVKRHGGKAYLARRIIAHFPPHRTYVEPFAGGLSVLLNKPRAAVEVASDRDAGLVHLYRTLQERPRDLAGRLAALDYSRATFDRAGGWLASADPLDRALGVLVRNRFSRGGLGMSFAWSERTRGVTRPGGPRPGDRNAWETIRGQLDAIAERLRGVRLLAADALDVIRGHDGPDVLLYCDPPYLPSTRTVRSAYAHEMTEAGHAALLDVLAACRGSVVLSGYPSGLYDDRLAGWARVAFDMPNHAGQGRSKQRRTEVLWIRPA